MMGNTGISISSTPAHSKYDWLKKGFYVCNSIRGSGTQDSVSLNMDEFKTKDSKMHQKPCY